MKRTCALRNLIFWTALAFSACRGIAADVPDNLITNGGFEAGMQIWRGDGKIVLLPDGNRVCEIEASKSRMKDLKQEFRLRQLQQVEVIFRARSINYTGPGIRISIHQIGGGSIIWNRDLPQDGSWKSFRIVYTRAPSPNDLRELNIATLFGTGQIQIDDVEVREPSKVALNEPPEPASPPAATPVPAPQPKPFPPVASIKPPAPPISPAPAPPVNQPPPPANAPPIDPAKFKFALDDRVFTTAPPDYNHHVSYPPDAQPANLEHISWIIEDPSGVHNSTVMDKTDLRIHTPLAGTYRVYVEYRIADKAWLISNVVNIKGAGLAAAGNGAPAPGKGKALAELLPGSKWLWGGSKDHVLEFRKDGKVSLDFWTAFDSAWEVTGPNQVTVTILSGNRVNSTSTIVFTEDRSSFSGHGFDPTRAIARSPSAP